MEESAVYHVPEGMSLMECRYTSDGNAHPSRAVLFGNSKEPPAYDHFRNILHYAGDPIFAPGERKGTLLFDMAQASQQNLAALNYGSCWSSEFSGFAPGYHKSYAASCYRSRSPEETDSILGAPVNEIEDGLKIRSSLSSRGVLQSLADRDHLKTASLVTGCEVAKDVGILRCPLDSDAAAVTGSVMKKILHEHFQDTSERSFHRSKTPASSSSSTPSPTLRGTRELQDRSRMESTRPSSLRMGRGMSQERSPSEQPDQFARMVSSDYSLVWPTFRQPLENTRSVELKGSRKWHQETSSGSHGFYQGPYPSFGALCCKCENKPKARCMTLVTNGVERASTRQKRSRWTRISRGDSSTENQRMLHITVERNRRKQMNDRLSALKALMPSRFVEKGDQASIIGGAIDFIKELEVFLESLLSKKRRRSYGGILGAGFNRFNIHPGPPPCAPYTVAAAGSAPSVLSATPTSENRTIRKSSKRVTMSSELVAVDIPDSARVINESMADCRSTAAAVEVKVFESDAIISITTHRRPNQLVRVIVALESLDLNILHVSVTTSNSTVLYNFNVKVGPECKMTVNHVAATLHQMFHSICADNLRDHIDLNRE